MLKLRETPEPTLRMLHICTICCQPMRPTDETTTASEVTYHTRCFRSVDMSPSEEPQMQPATSH